MGKIGRNQPCTCNSGKKYKFCCGAVTGDMSGVTAKESKSLFIGNVIEKFSLKLREKYNRQCRDLYDLVLNLNDDKMAWINENSDDEILMNLVITNATETIISEGLVRKNGKVIKISDLMDTPGQILMEAKDREIIKKIANASLKLYDITNVVEGSCLTFLEHNNPTAEPILITEKSFAQNEVLGNMVATRIIEHNGRNIIAGSLYYFPLMTQHGIEEIYEEFEDNEVDAESGISLRSLEIHNYWFENYVYGPRLPNLIDASTGEEMLFITDIYDLVDKEAFVKALEKQDDVDSTDNDTWIKFEEAKDFHRILASVSIKDNKVEVFYRTKSRAEEGKAWIEILAKDSIRYVVQEILDPMSPNNMENFAFGDKTKTDAKNKNKKIMKSAEELEEENWLINEYKMQHYKGWVDRPLPKLGNITPRNAIKTSHGLEEVKGLLRSFEVAEKLSAKDSHLEPFSFKFLWDELNLDYEQV